MKDDMAATESPRLLDQFFHRETYSRVVSGNDSPGADAHHHIHGNAMAQELAQDAQMCDSSQPAGAQDDANTDSRCSHSHSVKVRAQVKLIQAFCLY